MLHNSVSSNVKGMHDEMGSVKATVDRITSTMNAFMSMHFTQPSGKTQTVHLSC
jgi:hypothetical protein